MYMPVTIAAIVIETTSRIFDLLVSMSGKREVKTVSTMSATKLSKLN